MAEKERHRYWRERIAQAKARYLEWCAYHSPSSATFEDWLKWLAWRDARRKYFNDERQKLYGANRSEYAAYLDALAGD